MTKQISKINRYAQALNRHHDIEVCERMLKTATMYCNDREVESLINKALELIRDRRHQYLDATHAARLAAQTVHTFFVGDSYVEVSQGYEVRRIHNDAPVRLNIYKGDAFVGQVFTLDDKGSDVNGFGVFIRGRAEPLPERHHNERAALRHALDFLENM